MDKSIRMALLLQNSFHNNQLAPDDYQVTDATNKSSGRLFSTDIKYLLGSDGSDVTNIASDILYDCM